MNADTTHLLALAAALGWASGLRLYAVLFLTGAAGWLGWVALPPGLHLLQTPWMLGASGLMLFIEFFADKIPGLDTVWDVVHTVIRIPAGAALAGSVFGADAGHWATAAALLGGSLAATSHIAKATTRAAVNTSPEPFSNMALSLFGDALIPSVLWLAFAHPVLALVVVLGASAAMVVMTLLLLKTLRALLVRWRQGGALAWRSGAGGATRSTQPRTQLPVSRG